MTHSTVQCAGMAVLRTVRRNDTALPCASAQGCPSGTGAGVVQQQQQQQQSMAPIQQAAAAAGVTVVAASAAVLTLAHLPAHRAHTAL